MIEWLALSPENSATTAEETSRRKEIHLWLSVCSGIFLLLSIVAVLLVNHVNTPEFLYRHGLYEQAYEAGHPMAALQLARRAEADPALRSGARIWWQRAYESLSRELRENPGSPGAADALNEILGSGAISDTEKSRLSAYSPPPHKQHTLHTSHKPPPLSIYGNLLWKYHLNLIWLLCQQS